MMRKAKVALLRGHVASPYELQTYELLRGEFDLTLFSPHLTRVELSGVRIPHRTLYCPIMGHESFEGKRREWQAFRARATGRTHSFCGLADLLSGYDILHTADTCYCFSFEAVLAKRRNGSRLAVTQWENIPHLNEDRWMPRVIKSRVLETADLFLAVSDGAVQALREEGIGPERIVKTIPGIDTGHFSPGRRDPRVRKRYGIPEEAWVLLFAGRHVREKGVFTLLEAAKTMKASMSDLHLLMVGLDERGVQKRARREGLSGFVHFAGFVGYDSMPAFYRASDAFVLPSMETKGWKEQFGYVLAEAMASGLPVAGAVSGAIPEVVGKAGVLFAPGSAPGLASAVSGLRRREDAYSRKGCARARKAFPLKASAAAIAKAYRRLLNL